MPSYSNSAGNTGISNEYYNWKYFNSNLQRLQEYNAPMLNSRVGNIPPKITTDYMDVIGGLLNAGLGAFKAYQDYSYKLAEDYINKEGISGYNKAMKENNVPIQDNPLAMQHLRYLQGKTLSELNQLDFQTKIERGQFIGKSPLEIEKAMLDSKIDAPKDVEEYTPYVTQDDMFFEQGFWEDTDVQKEQNFVASTNVNNQYYKEEAQRAFTAKIGNLIDTGASPKAIENTYRQLQDSMGIYFSPAESTEFMKGMLTRAGNTAWGGAYIDQLAKIKPVGSDKTYGEIFGKDYINDLKISSENSRYKDDLLLRTYDLENANELILKGDFATLSSIATDEFKRNGKDTFRGKLYWQWAQQALNVQKAEAKSQAKKNKEAFKEQSINLIASDYNYKLMNKDTDFRSDKDDVFWSRRSVELGGSDGVKLTPEILDLEFEDGVRSGRYTPEAIAKMASNTYVTYNPAKNYLSKLSGSVFNDLDGQLTAYANGNLNTFNTPDGLGLLSEVYQADPSVLPLSSSQDVLLDTIMTGTRTGLYTFDRAMRNLGELKKNSTNKDFKALSDRFKRDVNTYMDLPIIGASEDLRSNPTTRKLIEQMSVSNMMLGKMDARKAIEAASRQLNDFYYQIGSSVVPKSFFSNSKLAPKYNEELADRVYDDVNKYLNENHMQFSQVDFQVNPITGDLEVIDYGGSGETLKTYTREWVDKEADSIANNVSLRMKYFGDSLENRQTKVENIYYND